MIENFFKEGRYGQDGRLLMSTCPYPNGVTQKGTTKVEKIKDCQGNFVGHKFIFNSIRSTGEIFNEEMTFTKDGGSLLTNELGLTMFGHFIINNCVLTQFIDGFCQVLGKNIKRKCDFKITNLGIDEKVYYFDDKTNEYILYWTLTYSFIL
jgi:hypothetical protein